MNENPPRFTVILAGARLELLGLRRCAAGALVVRGLMLVNRSAHVWTATALMVLVTSGCTWVDRVSLGNTGNQGNFGSVDPSISADGRYVAFQSFASNLVTGDTNNTDDIFARDAVAGTTTRVSLDSSGGQANGQSLSPAISADGRYVAFRSSASNLVAGDTNGLEDVFVRDTVAGTTTRVNVNGAGAQSNGSSLTKPAISADGHYVAFESDASNLITGDTNNTYDIFVRDTVAGTTSRESVGSAAAQANGESRKPAISADGHYVGFQSDASNLVTGDTNNTYDIFVRDTVAGTTSRVNFSSAALQANEASFDTAISADGHYVAFSSLASNLVTGDANNNYDVFVRDTVAGTTSRASLDNNENPANGQSITPAISADGRYIAFRSSASNLVNGDLNGLEDVFVRDTARGITNRVSAKAIGIETNNASIEPAISADGRYIAFNSYASNLITGDTNSVGDVYVRANPEPVTSRFTPDVFAPGTTTPVAVDGFDFYPGAVLLVDGVGTTLQNVTVVSPTEITADVVVAPDAPLGARNVFIELPPTGPGPAYVAVGFCQGCITVQAGCAGACLATIRPPHRQ